MMRSTAGQKKIKCGQLKNAIHLCMEKIFVNTRVK